MEAAAISNHENSSKKPDLVSRSGSLHDGVHVARDEEDKEPVPDGGVLYQVVGLVLQQNYLIRLINQNKEMTFITNLLKCKMS
jgi:hypothetical protein